MCTAAATPYPSRTRFKSCRTRRQTDREMLLCIQRDTYIYTIHEHVLFICIDSQMLLPSKEQKHIMYLMLGYMIATVHVTFKS